MGASSRLRIPRFAQLPQPVASPLSGGMPLRPQTWCFLHALDDHDGRDAMDRVSHRYGRGYAPNGPGLIKPRDALDRIGGCTESACNRGPLVLARNRYLRQLETDSELHKHLAPTSEAARRGDGRDRRGWMLCPCPAGEQDVKRVVYRLGLDAGRGTLPITIRIPVARVATMPNLFIRPPRPPAALLGPFR